MTKRFIPVLAACLFLMVGTAQAATSLAFPPPDTKGGKPLMQTLSGRATNRSFTAKPLSDKLLGDLLWAAYGVNRPNGKRTIPTAQNRQDLEKKSLNGVSFRLFPLPFIMGCFFYSPHPMLWEIRICLDLGRPRAEARPSAS